MNYKIGKNKELDIAVSSFINGVYMIDMGINVQDTKRILKQLNKEYHITNYTNILSLCTDKVLGVLGVLL